MTTEYNRAVLRVSIAQLAQQLGWNAIQGSPMELLTDVLERYILSLGRTTHRYSEQFGRTEPNLDDLGLAFQDHSIRLHELEDYVQHVEPISFANKVPEYPTPRPNQLRFPKPNSRELAEREEHVHDHLPPMNPEWDDEIIESAVGTPPALPGSSNVGTIPGSTTTTRESPVALGEKRPFVSPTDASTNKKLKTLPDEAGRSEYKMKGIVMSDTGFLTPVRAGKLPDAKTPPARLMSQSSVQSEVSVGSPPHHEESEGSPASSPPPVLASVMSETIDVQTHYGSIDDAEESNKTKPAIGPDLVLTGTEDIKKPSDSTPTDKVKIRPKAAKGKDKKALLKENKKGKEKGVKKKFKTSKFILKKEDKPEPGKETVTLPSDLGKKKLKKKKLKMKTKPSLTIRTDIPVGDAKSPRGGRSPRGRSPRSFKSPTISIVSPVSPRGPRSPRSPGRSPGRPPLPRSPKQSPGRSQGRPAVKSPLKSPKTVKSPEKVPKVPKEKRSPGRPRKDGKPQKKSKSDKVTAKLKKMLAKKQKTGEAEAPSPPPTMPVAPVAPPAPLAPMPPFVDEPDVVFNIQPLPMDQIPPQTPSPAPTEAAEQEPYLSDYQDIDSPHPKEEEENLPKELPHLEKQEPEGDERAITPVLAITSVQSIPLSSYEAPNGTAAAVAQDVDDEKMKSEKEKQSPTSVWQPTVSTPAAKIDAFHFSASESDNDDNDFSFITKSIGEKIEDMDKETGKDAFAFTDEDEFDISVGNDALSPTSVITPSVLLSPPAPLTLPTTPKPAGSPTKSPKARGRPPKKDKGKVKIKKIKIPPPKEPKLALPEWPKVTVPKLTPEDVKRFDYPSAEAAGLTITTPTSPPFSPPATSSPPAVAPMKISIGGGTTKFTIKMGGKKEEGKSEEKKKKKKKNKDKDKEKSKEERKKEKALKKQEKKLKKEKEGHSIPKLKFKFGGGDSSVSVSASSSKQDPKSEHGIPKLLIKPMAPSPKQNPASFSPAPTRLSPCPTKSPDFSSYTMSPLRPTSPSTSPRNNTVPPSPTAGPRRSLSMSPGRNVLRSPSPESASSRSPSPTRTPPRFSASIPPPPPSSKSHSASSAMPTKPAGNLPPPPPPSSGKTSTSPIAPPLSSVKKGSRAIITETQGKIYNEKGDIIWICPTCKMPDDGSPMIGCDTCDDWYHWVCMNITTEPSDEDWYCPRCVLKNKGGEEKKKRGRKPKAGRGRGKKKM